LKGGGSPMVELISQTIPNGNTINYKIVNGTAYRTETNDKIIEVLESARANKTRIRIFYGDQNTGKDWNEEWDIMGTIGRSTGTIKIPLLIKNSRSFGGGGLLDHCIVKITIDKKVVYKHPAYNIAKFDIIATNNRELRNKGYFWTVIKDDKEHANFKTEKQACNFIDFITGSANSK
jgi:hypothetical protein